MPNRSIRDLTIRLVASGRGAVLALVIGVALPASEPAAQPSQDRAGRVYRVERVVDGDTVILERLGRVRLIGVNTPETVDPRRPVERFGAEASVFLKELLTGARVRVEYDQERTDRYGRTLAYLFLPDGTFVNEEIIRRGYGFAYTRFPFRYLERFRQREREAREAGAGLWKE